MKRTKYTAEFKKEAVKQVIDKGHIARLLSQLGYAAPYCADLVQFARAQTAAADNAGSPPSFGCSRMKPNVLISKCQ